jgi:hypothetical protein
MVLAQGAQEFAASIALEGLAQAEVGTGRSARGGGENQSPGDLAAVARPTRPSQKRAPETSPARKQSRRR